jgi:nicotinamide riboside kinase
MKIAVLGAESTGKSTLCHNLAKALTQAGRPAYVVDEYLREWCLNQQRTPRADEQASIAEEQMRRIESISGIAVADTTSLMTAIYSDVLFSDDSLFPQALGHLKSFSHVLVTALDLPWVADSYFRDGPASQLAVHQRLQAVLDEHHIAYAMVYGKGAQRLQAAWQAVMPTEQDTEAASRSYHRWAASCEKCSDPECEHRLFKGLKN